jgi:glycosyltransferase involved in cell wall biosynthesis
VLHLTTHLNIGGISSYLLALTQGLISLGQDISIASSGGKLESEFKKHGVSLFQVPLNTKSELSYKLLISAFQLRKLQKKYNWQLIHAHTRVSQCLAQILSTLLNIDYVTTAHGFYTHHLGRKLLPCLGKNTIANSYSVEEDLKTNYPSYHKQISTIHHGIDINHFHTHHISDHIAAEFKKKYAIENIPTLGIIGRLAQEKGHLNLLHVFKILISTHQKNVQLLIVGDGKYRDKIVGKIKELQLEKYVRVIPSQKDPRVALSLIDIYVTHHEGPEGFGLSTLEAMAMSKPVVISYKKGGMKDFITHNQEGVLLQNASVQEMANSIKQLLESDDLRTSLGRQAAQKVKNSFSHLMMAKNTIGIYEATLKNH